MKRVYYRRRYRNRPQLADARMVKTSLCHLEMIVDWNETRDEAVENNYNGERKIEETNEEEEESLVIRTWDLQERGDLQESGASEEET